MREIKFKVWWKDAKLMSEVESIRKDGEVEFFVEATYGNGVKERVLQHLEKEQCEIVQYTGLHDKNGKKIYEGDILKIGTDLIEEVVWVDENNWVSEKCPVNGFVNHESIYKQKPEIIGNIYENPELLKNGVRVKGDQ